MLESTGNYRVKNYIFWSVIICPFAYMAIMKGYNSMSSFQNVRATAKMSRSFSNSLRNNKFAWRILKASASAFIS